MKIVVLQIKDVGSCDYAFRDYDERKFSLDDYKVVFSEDISLTYSPEAYCDKLYCKLNGLVQLPAGCRSMSVSDVVVIGDDIYYCESIGWKKLDTNKILKTI